MLIVKYYRKQANMNEIRCFKNINELNIWLLAMKELEEEYYITRIDYKDMRDH